MKPTSSRDAILDAAQSLAAARGAGHVTLDAVARACGLSKGGVLYHFPSKNHLIDGMLGRLIERNQTLMATHTPAEVNGRSLTLAMLDTVRAFREELSSPVAMAVLAAGAEQPALLAPLRDYIASLNQQLTALPGDHDLQRVLWAAADGLLFQHLLELSPVPAAERGRLEDRLKQLAQELLT